MESARTNKSDVDSLKIIVLGKTEQDNIKNSTTNSFANNFPNFENSTINYLGKSVPSKLDMQQKTTLNPFEEDFQNSYQITNGG